MSAPACLLSHCVGVSLVDASDDDDISHTQYGFIAVSLSSKIFMVESFAPVPMVKNHATSTSDDNDRLLTEACPEQGRRDGLCSTRTLTDMTGAVTDTYFYDAYGILLDKTDTTINPYLYRGEQFDDDLSAYYLRARYYQPGTGRFLTTDPEEGFESDPISLHRYVYGNGDPVNYLDPLGETSLKELSVTNLITMNLAAFGIGSILEHYFGVYSFLGEHVFPDAYILGFNGFISYRLFDKFMETVGLPAYLHPSSKFFGMSGSFVGAVELLLNIPSGQVGLYFILGGGGQFGTIPHSLQWLPRKPQYRFNYGFGAYQGYVWNLWSVHDYTEHFVGFGIGGETLGLKTFGYAAFFDPKRFLFGPWGIARILFEKGLNKSCNSFYPYSRFYGYSYYWLREHSNRPNEWEVGTLAVTLSIAGNLLQAILNAFRFCENK